MRKLYFILISVLFISVAHAAQIKGVIDNETVTAKVSSLDITRIIVQNDRIKSLKGIRGAYTRENDENNGEVYLQPTAAYQNASFTVLIETEKNRHFTLLLIPVSVPGGTLMLVPKGVDRHEAARFEDASDYQTTLSQLVKAMATDDIPEGYSIRQVGNKTLYHFGNIATLRLKTVYSGLRFEGQIYELTNTQSYPIHLNEKQFFKQGISAISLESIMVAPHGKIKLIRVVNHA